MKVERGFDENPLFVLLLKEEGKIIEFDNRSIDQIKKDIRNRTSDFYRNNIVWYQLFHNK